MQKYLIPTSVVFMALSLGTFMVRGGLESVGAFGLASAVFGFLCFLERKQVEELDHIQAEIKTLRDQIANISVAIGWSR